MQTIFYIKPFVVGEDYPEICEWWKEHGWRYMPLEYLSKRGFVVCDGKVKCCAAWLFETDSAWLLFEFLVTNPRVGPRKSKAAIDFLLDNVKGLAKGRKIFTVTTVKSLVRLYREHGFIVGDHENTTMTFQGAL